VAPRKKNTNRKATNRAKTGSRKGKAVPDTIPLRSSSSSVAPLSGIRDNHRRGKVADFLTAKIKDGSKLSVVSAYFTIYAFDALKDHLTHISHLDFLFGEPRFVKSLDPDRTDKKAFKIVDEGIELANRLNQKRAARECADWIREKVAIKSVKHTCLLHGKMYHIANGDVEDAIMGSSNFTVRGLGLGAAGNNIELNLEVDSNRDRRDLKAWFNELWNDEQVVENVKEEVLLYLAQHYQNHAPEFIYYKTLFHIFEKYLLDQEQGGLLNQDIKLIDTDIWKILFEFQKDGAKGAINKILKHNGCILADSVGLGKTFEALAVIKYFELRNERVLVLCPKKLRENWTVYQAQNNSELNPFIRDRFGYTVLAHTDLSREGGLSGDIDLASLNWGNYDLVVIDESHNFRNNTKGRRDEYGQLIRKSRYERLMEDIIQTGVKTKVLLLSATPVNNDLKDLRNQLYFMTENHDDAFRDSIGIASLQETLRGAQHQFARWAREHTVERKTSDLLEKLSAALFTLLDELTIARSRKHIQKYYKDSIAQLGGFPERKKPIAVFPVIDLAQKFMSYDRLNDEIMGYQLSLFNPSKYLKQEFENQYLTQTVFPFTQKQREFFLIAMMRINFLKRLESSVHSFAITIDRTIKKIEELEAKIALFKRRQEANGEVIPEDVSVEDEEDQDLQNANEVGAKLKYRLAHLDVDRWLKDLDRDRQQLNLLYVTAKDVTQERDAKLKDLMRLIEAKVQHPTKDKLGHENRKVLVFTAFADTAVYLYQALRDWARNHLGIHIALVSGGAVGNQTTFEKSDYTHILTNFSPRAKQRSKMKTLPQEGEIDLLIATDCISEGQNLQDCDYLINYDIHWNPVRIIQRFGRIDRIGSVNHTVQLVNFWPTPNLDKYITLKTRVEARMALVDIAATFEDNILKTDELEELIQEDLKYRDKQLLRLKDEVLDLEDFSESIALNEFTLDDFRIELSKYIESNRRLLEEAPFGLYAVVPPESSYAVAAPGVIFCLKQRGPADGTETINPLQPYFLVYVREDREVRYTFAQPKQILELFRALCSGQAQPNESLCNLFDQETKNGEDMTRYTDLLNRAVQSIASTFRRRMVTGLQSGRSFVVPEQQAQAQEATEFELITWLVIKAS
jgi:SNF2 family DNA or RNA helicase